MKLYLTLVRSQLMYCTPIWHSYLQKDIQNIERIQRRATKFILNDYDSNYKTRLVTLKLLPLMYLLELQDIIFTVKSLKYPTKGFNILHISRHHSVHPIHVHHPTVSLNIFLILITIIDTHSFTDCLDFGMPSLLLIYIYLSPPSKSTLGELKEHFWNHFVSNFNEDPCTFHLLCPCNKCYNSPPLVNFNSL